MTNTRAISRMQSWGEASARLSGGINKWVERLCAVLLAAMIVDVWIGVFGRYVFELPVTWAEELARYLMIWAALIAVSCGVARREHVAVTELLHRLPRNVQRRLCAAIDALAFAFFAFIGYFGIDMTEKGASQYASIFDMTMWIPFASVPVSAALVCLQLALMGVRDFTFGGLPAEVVEDI